MTPSLFPDYAILSNGRTEVQAMHLAQQLRDVDLMTLATDVDRRMVVSRLRREGIDNVMQLLLLTEDEVLGWYNVGPVFLAILAEMHRSVLAAPERVVDEWYHQHRLFVLPDDLRCQETDERDFFGMVMETETHAASSDDHDVEPLLLLERCLVAAVEMAERRSPDGVVLRRFFIDGMNVDAIVAECGLASNAALYRIVDMHFCTPLLKGYAFCGIQFGEPLLEIVRKLRRQLLYAPASCLDVLCRMSSVRYLYFLGLTLLRRTQAETFWTGDYIVRDGEVEQCRRTLRDLLSQFQFRVVAAKETVLRHSIKGANASFLRAVLHSHPFIENDRKDYRLVGERLTYECSRLARIVYDAHAPLTFDELLTRYEQLYMERPHTLSIGNVRARFPQVHSIRRGVWEWQ